MEFWVLGSLEVLGENGPIVLTRRRERALLSRLLIKVGQVVPTDRLLEELWPKSPPEAARHSLHVHVSSLRRALGSDVVVTQRPGYLLAAEPDQVDAFRFEALARQGRRALRCGDPEEAARHLGEALVLWRDRPLPDLDDQPWVRSHITHLQEVRAGALDSLLEAELALGRHAEVVDRAGQEVEDHPFRERLWGHLMLALYRLGRQTEALAAFAEASRLLAEELGIEPGPALRRLEEAIVLQKPELDWEEPRLEGRRYDSRRTRW